MLSSSWAQKKFFWLTTNLFWCRKRICYLDGKFSLVFLFLWLFIVVDSFFFVNARVLYLAFPLPWTFNVLELCWVELSHAQYITSTHHYNIFMSTFSFYTIVTAWDLFYSFIIQQDMTEICYHLRVSSTNIPVSYFCAQAQKERNKYHSPWQQWVHDFSDSLQTWLTLHNSDAMDIDMEQKAACV